MYASDYYNVIQTQVHPHNHILVGHYLAISVFIDKLLGTVRAMGDHRVRQQIHGVARPLKYIHQGSAQNDLSGG